MADHPRKVNASKRWVHPDRFGPKLMYGLLKYLVSDVIYFVNACNDVTLVTQLLSYTGCEILSNHTLGFAEFKTEFKKPQARSCSIESKMDENATGSYRKRRRPALACEKCRRRKIKCDRNTPCDQCIRSKSDTCTYLADDNTAPTWMNYGVNMGHMANSSTTSSAMTHQSPSSTANISAAGALDSLADEFPTAGNSSSTNDLDKERASTVRALSDQQHHSRRVPLDPANTESGEPALGSLPDYTALPTKGIYSKARLFGQSHWMNSIEQV